MCISFQTFEILFYYTGLTATTNVILSVYLGWLIITIIIIVIEITVFFDSAALSGLTQGVHFLFELHGICSVFVG